MDVSSVELDKVLALGQSMLEVQVSTSVKYSCLPVLRTFYGGDIERSQDHISAHTEIYTFNTL